MTADLAIIQLLLSTLLIGVTLIWGIFRYRRSGYWRRGVHNKLQAYLLWTLSALITLSCFIPLAHLYTEHLWFENVGYADVFWGLQKVRWGIFGVCFIVAAGFMNANTAIAHILCPESREFRRWTYIQTFSFHRMVIWITLIAALLLAAPMLLLDDVVLRYLNQPDAAVARLGNLASEEGGGGISPFRDGPEFLPLQLPSPPMGEPLGTGNAVGNVCCRRVAVSFLLPSRRTFDVTCEATYPLPRLGFMAVAADRCGVAESRVPLEQGLHETTDEWTANAPRLVLRGLPPCECHEDLLWCADRHRRGYRG